MSEAAFEATRAQKRPARCFVLIFAALAALGASANLLLDSFGIFGTGVVRQVFWTDRNDKLDVYARLRTKPQIVFLGSSSMVPIDPACATELTGQSAFNFAVVAGTFIDYLPFLKFIKSTGDARVKRFVVGIDYMSFWRGKPRRLLHSPRMRAFLDTGQLLRFWASVLPEYLLDMKSAYRGLLALREPPLKIRDDGGMLDGNLINLPTTPPTAEELIKECQSDYEEESQRATSHGGFDRLDEERIADLERFLVAAQADGIEVDAYIPPIHPEYLRLMQHDLLGRRYAEMVALLHDLEQRRLLHYHETTTVAEIHGEASDFLDPSHMGQTGTNRLLLTLFGKTRGCGVDLL